MLLVVDRLCKELIFDNSNFYDTIRNKKKPHKLHSVTHYVFSQFVSYSTPESKTIPHVVPGVRLGHLQSLFFVPVACHNREIKGTNISYSYHHVFHRTLIVSLIYTFQCIFWCYIFGATLCWYVIKPTNTKQTNFWKCAKAYSIKHIFFNNNNNKVSLHHRNIAIFLQPPNPSSGVHILRGVKLNYHYHSYNHLMNILDVSTAYRRFWQPALFRGFTAF